MKRIFLPVLFLAACCGVIFGITSVSRAQGQPMTEAHIARIRANCVEAQTQLSQLHTTDALLRVNRGQLYERILTKLMSPLNSRIALNRLDNSSLVAVSATYEQQLMAFRLDYQQYEEAMSNTLKINCTNQPVAFYDSVADARTKRQKVHESTKILQDSMQSYKDQFELFASSKKERS